jgi:transcriptional regulator with AAA-type ATPase domain
MDIKRIGAYLIEKQICSKKMIDAALERQLSLKRQGAYKPVGQILVENGDLYMDTLDLILREQGEAMLHSVALFKSLSPELLKKIAGMAEFRAFPKGEVIIHEGDQGDSFYHVVSGSARVFQISEDGIDVTLNTLEPGESFGEMALLTGEPRSASVDTKETSCFLVISKQGFEDVVAKSPEFSLALSKILSSRLSKGSFNIVRATASEKAYQRFVSEQRFEPAAQLVGRSRSIDQLRARIKTAAQNDKPVLILGESGTEKGDVGGMIHRFSNRRDGPFLTVDIKAVNMGRVVDRSKERDPIRLELAQSSTIFGHAKGALSFAQNSRLGLIQVGDGGTVVIENIEQLAENVQSKLVDFLVHGCFQPMGSSTPLYTSVRVVATTSADLGQRVQDGKFNAKLFDLLGGTQTLEVPPLRNRKKDLRQLVDHMLGYYSEQTGKSVDGIENDVYKSIMAYDWPGNTDELRVVIRRAVNLAQDNRLTPEDILIGTSPLVTGKLSFNVLKLDRVQQVFQSNTFPGSAQLITAFFFTVILFFGFFGSQVPESNLSLVLTWGLWEPFVILSCIPAARMWCAVCPVGALSSLISRKYGLGRNIPSFIRTYGVYLSAIGLGLIFLFEVVFRMPFSPLATAFLMLSITLPAVVLALIYRRRVWCRFLCPLGKLVGFLSSCSVLELRANQNICNSDCIDHACYVGHGPYEGCPVFEAPFSINTNQNCILCGNCIKNCPNHSPVLNLRTPGHELWSFRKPDQTVALFGPLIIGTQLFRGLEKTGYFHPYAASFDQGWIFSLGLMIVTTFFAFLFVQNGGRVVFRSMASASRVKSSLMAYALVPLAVAFEVSFHFERLISWGGQLFPVLGRQLGFSWDFLGLSMRPGIVKAYQIFFVLVGVIAAQAVLLRLLRAFHDVSLKRLSSRENWPILTLAVVYIWFFWAG